MSAPAIDDLAIAAAALVALPRMSADRLARLMTEWPDPRDVLMAIGSGRAVDPLKGPGRRDPTALVRSWSARIDLEATKGWLRAHATHVFVAGRPGYPIDVGLPDHPRVLFAEGDRADALERPRVGVVGTRAATPHGLADAHELGSVLARAGVTVVSGLAIGIDGASHEGAIGAGGTVVGVLGTGLDVVYPRRHVRLHREVRECGLIVSEYRYGTEPHPARFPARNRIIAALSDVLVVVEATATGGARITADLALEYGRELCVYPGSRRNPSARGSNEMLRTAHVIVEPDDVLGVLGLSEGSHRSPTVHRDRLGATANERAVMRALGGEPATVDEVTSTAELDPGPAAVAVAGLIRSGLLRRAHGLLWPT